MQPGKPRVVEHELEKRTASFDSALLALVPDASVLEQRLVHAQKAASHVIELLSQLELTAEWKRMAAGWSLSSRS